jgi:hypothetical protein
MNLLPHLSRAALSLSLAAALLAAPLGASARERHTTLTGPQGQSATRDVTRSHGDVSSTTTGPNGRSSSRVVERSAGGTTATVTGPTGKTWQRQTTRSAQ